MSFFLIIRFIFATSMFDQIVDYYENIISRKQQRKSL